VYGRDDLIDLLSLPLDMPGILGHESGNEDRPGSMKKAVATALATAFALAGVTSCSQTRHRAKTTPAAAVSSPAPEPLTPQVASAAFRTFVSNDDVARTSGDERLGLWWTSEGQSQLAAAAFREAVAGGTPVPRYRYDSPALYVPRLLPEGPQWFVASARRTTADGKDPQNVLMGFVQSKPNQRWRLSLSTLLDKKQKPPKIAVDAQGYAKALATFDAKLLIPPRVVPSIQATLAEEGPQNVAADVMATGKHTTDYYSADQKSTKSKAAKKTKKSPGLRIDTVYATTSFPIFPLATVDGGGIVLYALSRDTVTAKPNKKKSGGPPLPVPKEALPFISPERVQSEIDVNETLQFAALVPPKADKGERQAKATIIASDGGIIRVSAPTR
jgi:hypothetical protein